MTDDTAANIDEGYEARGATKTATSYRTWLFSGGWPRMDGWPAKNVHTDLEFARDSGLAARNASGAMMAGYLTELMVDTFGEGWLRNGAFSLKFIRAVGIGDRVTAMARVASKRVVGSGTGFEAEVWCENQDGDKVVVGTARVQTAGSPKGAPG
jgi:hypothetical protein